MYTGISTDRAHCATDESRLRAPYARCYLLRIDDSQGDRLIPRRLFLQSAVSAAAVAQLPSLSFAQDATKKAETDLTAVLDYFYEEAVLANPESRTSLGLDKGAHAAAKSKLQDRSIAGLKKEQNVTRVGFERMKKIDRTALTPASRAGYDAFHYLFTGVVDAYDRFQYG